MEKKMCYAALGVAGLVGLIAVLDLALGILGGGGSKEVGNPFTIADIFMLLASGIVGYLGYNAMRDLR